MEIEAPLRIDHARIGQMFSNLLGNALTHGAPDHPVWVKAITTDNKFELSVENRGEPIPQQSLNKLFQPFERAEGSKGQGLGLGLFIASEIARAHGGTLGVLSDEKMTRFSFSMPNEFDPVARSAPK